MALGRPQCGQRRKSWNAVAPLFTLHIACAIAAPADATAGSIMCMPSHGSSDDDFEHTVVKCSTMRANDQEWQDLRVGTSVIASGGSVARSLEPPLLAAPDDDRAIMCHSYSEIGDSQSCDISSGSSTSTCSRLCAILGFNDGDELALQTDLVPVSGSDVAESGSAMAPLGNGEAVLCRTTVDFCGCRLLTARADHLQQSEELIISLGKARSLQLAPLATGQALICYEDLSQAGATDVAVVRCKLMRSMESTLWVEDTLLAITPPCEVLDCQSAATLFVQDTQRTQRIHYQLTMASLSSASATQTSVLCYAVYGSCRNCLGRGVCELVQSDGVNLRKINPAAALTKSYGAQHLALAPLGTRSAVFCFKASSGYIICSVLRIVGDSVEIGDEIEIARRDVMHLALSPLRSDAVLLCYAASDHTASAGSVCGTLRVSTSAGASSVGSIVASPDFVPMAQNVALPSLVRVMVPQPVAATSTTQPDQIALPSNLRGSDKQPVAEPEAEGGSIWRLVVIILGILVGVLFSMRCIYRLCSLWLGSLRQPPRTKEEANEERVQQAVASPSKIIRQQQQHELPAKYGASSPLSGSPRSTIAPSSVGSLQCLAHDMDDFSEVDIVKNSQRSPRQGDDIFVARRRSPNRSPREEVRSKASAHSRSPSSSQAAARRSPRSGHSKSPTSSETGMQPSVVSGASGQSGSSNGLSDFTSASKSSRRDASASRGKRGERTRRVIGASGER